MSEVYGEVGELLLGDSFHEPPRETLSGADATPPPCRAPGWSYTPVAALSAISSVAGVSQLQPPLLKGPVAPHPGLPCRVSVAGSLDFQNPVALQRVEHLHLRVSRYTLTLRRNFPKFFLCSLAFVECFAPLASSEQAWCFKKDLTNWNCSSSCPYRLTVFLVGLDNLLLLSGTCREGQASITPAPLYCRQRNISPKLFCINWAAANRGVTKMGA